MAGEAVIAEPRVPGSALRGPLRFNCGVLDGEIPFRVLFHGEVPGPSHGVDVDEEGYGLLRGGGVAAVLIRWLVSIGPLGAPPGVRSCCRSRGWRGSEGCDSGA